MAVTDKDLEIIGAYIRSQLPKWVVEDRIFLSASTADIDQLLERSDRVEERMEKNHELMKQMFEAMNKRSEELREDGNKRF